MSPSFYGSLNFSARIENTMTDNASEAAADYVFP